MIVDVHVHFLSPLAIDAARRAPSRFGVRVIDDGEHPRLVVGNEATTRPLLAALYTLDRHRAFLDEQGIDAAIFGPLMDVAGYSLPPEQGSAWSRAQNEALATSLADAGGRHFGLATLPLQSPTVAADELRFAVSTLGLRGAMELGVPVVLHPFLLEAVERFGRHYLHNLVGYPFETTLAAGSLILGGTLDRFPALEVVLVHGGGFLPYHIGRFDRGHATRAEARADGAALPSGYLRRFHYDTLVQFKDALAYLVKVVGHDRVLLGSDHPFWLGDPMPTKIVREASLSESAEAAILGDNAAHLFRLTEAPRRSVQALGLPHLRQRE